MGGGAVTDPKTLAEHLDAAENGEQFSAALNGLFGVLEKLKDDE